MIHLDTNFLIDLLKPGTRGDQLSQQWLKAGETLQVSAIAWAELLCGPLTPKDEQLAKALFIKPEPFLDVDAEFAARLFNLTGRRSRSLPDCMIAAVAIRCGAKLATINTADFQPFVPNGLGLA
jgi:predicted nucleic acid-binding protein